MGDKERLDAVEAACRELTIKMVELKRDHEKHLNILDEKLVNLDRYQKGLAKLLKNATVQLNNQFVDFNKQYSAFSKGANDNFLTLSLRCNKFDERLSQLQKKIEELTG